MLQVGTKLGVYEILSPLGVGGMGEVYRARDSTLGRDVAIKVLLAGPDSGSRISRRFEREARAVASLNHPNIVTVFGIHEHGGLHFIAMELVEGTTLEQRITPGGLPATSLLEVAIPLAEALVAAHRKVVVHRDLKPANIMITEEGRVKVLDFGLAKLMGEQAGAFSQGAQASTALTSDGGVLGTAPYMSPEQLRGDAVDHRTDLFSVGVILYELATGARPFQGASFVEVSSAILRDPPLPLHEVAPDLPPRLGRLVERCLEKDPARRLSSAADLLGELRTLQGELRSGAGGGSAGGVDPASASAAGSTSRARRTVLRRGPVAAALLLAAAGVWRALVAGGPGAGARQEPVRLAILPFQDNSPEPYPWLASGLADGIGSTLARANPTKLRVVGPHTAAHYAPGAIQDLIADLGVDFVLLGSTQVVDGQVAARATLVEADGLSSRPLGEIRGPLDDPWQLQVRLTDSILEGLPFELTGAEQQRVGGRAPEPEAHIAYMQGRYLAPWEASTESMLLALAYFERAIELDPGYTLAYCGLADIQCFLATWGSLAAGDVRAGVEEAVARALELDDSLAEVHVSAGLVAMFLDWDWPRAEAAFGRALELNPEIPEAHEYLGRLLVLVGRYDDAIEHYEAALQLDPVSSSHYSALGILYANTGRLAEAEEVLQKARQFDALSAEAAIWLGFVRQQQGRSDDAVVLIRRIVEATETPDLATRCFLAVAHAMAGEEDEARAQLRAMEESGDAVPDHRLWFAEVHAALGERDRAFALLDEALRARESWLPHCRLDPGTVGLRDDPRFARLYEEMGLPSVDLSGPRIPR